MWAVGFGNYVSAGRCGSFSVKQPTSLFRGEDKHSQAAENTNENNLEKPLSYGERYEKSNHDLVIEGALRASETCEHCSYKNTICMHKLIQQASASKLFLFSPSSRIEWKKNMHVPKTPGRYLVQKCPNGPASGLESLPKKDFL